MKTNLILMSALIFNACSKKSDDVDTGTVNLKMKSNGTALTADELALATGNGVYDDLPISTSASSTGLYSLKMYFREIKLCTSLQFSSGTGYQVDGTCATVYSNTSDDYTGTEAPTAADRTKFAAASEGKFYDILSETDRAKLSTGTAIAAGTYNYGIIETHPWVKMTAKNGTLCTKAAGAKENTAVGGDGVKTYYTSVDSFTCGATDSAEEVLDYITNANSTFKFLKPFVIGKDEEFTVDLAFNLDSEIKTIKGGDTVPGGMRSTDAQNSFYVPMLRLGAAPRKATETTKTETYYLGTTSQKERIRVQLYYNSADTTKSIIGVSSTVLATASSTKTKANNPIYVSGASQTGDVVTFTTWDGTTVLTFTRGSAGTATVTCTGSGGGAALEGCSGLTTLPLTYSAPTVSEL